MVRLPITRRSTGLGMPATDLFDDMFRRFGRMAMLPTFESDVLNWAPPIELTEVDDEFVVTAELPGIALKDVEAGRVSSQT